MNLPKSRFVFLSLAVAGAVAASFSAISGAAPPAAAAASAPAWVRPAVTPSLKELYKNDFLIGTALDFTTPDAFSDKELAIIKSQFNVITPENSMKPQIQPGPEEWNWTVADNLVKFCQENNIKIHGHTLAWHAQTPNWFFTGDDGQAVAKDVAIARLKNHILTEVGHFKGKIYSWDVVNEAINDGAGGLNGDENLRPSPWIRAIGPEYITMAFGWAHEADPDAKLFYNDYNIEKGAKHKASLALLKRLIADKAPIYGVGIQGHWSLNNTPFADIDQAIADYKALGLKVSISELDITIQGQGGGQLNAAGAAPGAAGAPGADGAAGAGGAPGADGAPGGGRGRRGFGRGAATAPGDAPAGGAFGGAPGGFGGPGGGPGALAGGPPATGPAATGPGRGRGGRGGRGGGGGFGGGGGAPASPAQLKVQAEDYSKIFVIFEKYKDTIDRVTFWGLNDARSWRRGQSPLLFDNQNDPKEDLFSIAEVKTGAAK